MSSKTFELRVVTDRPEDYGLALYRMPARGESVNGSARDWQQIVSVHGMPMQAVMDQILTMIKQAGYSSIVAGHGNRYTDSRLLDESNSATISAFNP